MKKESRKKLVARSGPIVAVDLLLITTLTGALASIFAFVLSGTYQLVAIFTLSGLLISLFITLGFKVFLRKSIHAVIKGALLPAHALGTMFSETRLRLPEQIRNSLRCLVAYILEVILSVLVFGVFVLSSLAIDFVNRTWAPEADSISFTLRVLSVFITVCGAVSAVVFMCASTVRTITELFKVLRLKKLTKNKSDD